MPAENKQLTGEILLGLYRLAACMYAYNAWLWNIKDRLGSSLSNEGVGGGGSEQLG